MRQHTIQAREEPRPVLGSLLCPGHIGQSQQTGEKLILHVGRRATELGPHRGLYSHEQRLVGRLPIVLHRFIQIDILQRIVAEVGQRFEPLGALVANEVEYPGRSHYKPMPLLGGFEGCLAHALPAIDDGPFGQRAVGELVPTHHLFTFTAHIVAHAGHKVALQLLDMFDVLGFHASLTLGTAGPVYLRSLIAPQMDILRGEELGHLVDHILEKGEYAVVTSTIDNL